MMDANWNPGKLLQASGGYWTSAAIHAAVKLDIFTVLDSTPQTAEELSAAIQADLRGTTHLLRALLAIGLLKKTSDAFSNTDFATAFLSRKSHKYMGYIIAHHHHLFDSFARLDQAVKTGKPTRNRISHESTLETETFLLGMYNQGMQQAPKIAKSIDLSKRKHLLDLGGGPGTYAVHFCLANPNLTATIWDLPSSRRIAKQITEKFGLNQRIAFKVGDFTKDKIAGPYDVIFLSHILHGEGPDTCLKILQNAVSSLEPGGLAIIHEFILNSDGNGPVFPALFSLNMLVGTPCGQSYTENDLVHMLSNAGLHDIHRIPIDSPNGSGIIVGSL